MATNASMIDHNSELEANLKVSGEVRAWLARRGLRQIWLADTLGLSQSVVSKRLRGLLPFTAPELIKIASSLNISLGELLGGIVNEKNPQPAAGGSSFSVAGEGFEPSTSGL